MQCVVYLARYAIALLVVTSFFFQVGDYPELDIFEEDEI